MKKKSCTFFSIEIESRWRKNEIVGGNERGSLVNRYSSISRTLSKLYCFQSLSQMYLFWSTIGLGALTDPFISVPRNFTRLHYAGWKCTRVSHVRARIAAVVIQSEGGSGGGLEREEGWRVERRWRALGEDDPRRWKRRREWKAQRSASHEYELLKPPVERVSLLYARDNAGSRGLHAAGFPRSRS